MKKQLAATFLVMSLALPAAAQGFDDTSFDSYRPDLARGERLFEVGACASCHLEKGATLDPAAPVLGGGMEIDSPTFGTIRVPNITGSSAGIGDRLDAVLSVDSVGVFKPAAQVYDLVGERFVCTPDEVLFVSSNGWDAASAASYGFTVAWVNRRGDPIDRLPGRPHHVLNDLTQIPDLKVF